MMKKLLLFILLIPIAIGMFQQQVLAQNIMTIGEVFDYEVGDIFEYKSNANNPPPHGSRKTITAKYFSNDTVFYGRYNQNYSSQVVMEPEPHLEYYFNSSYDTVSYTNLDSLILTYEQAFQEDTTIYFSDQYCGVLINSHLGPIGGPFEPYIHDTEFGRGLGVVNLYQASADNGYEPYGFYMTYYSKGNVECGVADPLVTSITHLQKPTTNLTLYPNPASTTITIQSMVNSPWSVVNIYNAQGQQVSHPLSRGECASLSAGKGCVLDISPFPTGLYYLHLQSAEGVAVKKFEVIH